MGRADYEAAVRARIDRAVRVPFKAVSIDNWSPQVAQCHENVDAWVRASAGSAVVSGWVTYASFGGSSFVLTAHSVVRDPDGVLFDITPLHDESVRRGMQFIEHEGDAASFDAMKANGIFIHCLSSDEPSTLDEIAAVDFDPMGEAG